MPISTRDWSPSPKAHQPKNLGVSVRSFFASPRFPLPFASHCGKAPQVTVPARQFPQHDANFNVTAITNTGGTVQERYTPDPFGVVTFRDASGNTISASAKDWVFLHQGGQADILGHYDFRNRILSPTLGRWLTNDPLGFEAGDNNFYRYVANGPGNGLDPSGLRPGAPVRPAPTGPVIRQVRRPWWEGKEGAGGFEEGPVFNPAPFNPLLPLPIGGPLPRGGVPVLPGETTEIRPHPNSPEFKDYLRKKADELEKRYNDCDKTHELYDAVKGDKNWDKIKDWDQLKKECENMMTELNIRIRWLEKNCDYIAAEYRYGHWDYEKRQKYAKDAEQGHKDYKDCLEKEVYKCYEKLNRLDTPEGKGGRRREKGDRMPKHEKREDKWR